MRISVFGTGYVGLVTGVCLAGLGNEVLCADIDEAKVAALGRGGTTIYEPGLKERQERAIADGHLKFTHNLAEAVAYGDMLFIAVGTPDSDGMPDLSAVESVARTIGAGIDREVVVVMKSTVPVSTADRVRDILEQRLGKRGLKFAIHVVANPEFLREGSAVYDFLNPDRIIVGCDEKDAFAKEAMQRLYEGIARTSRPILFMDTRSAELAKYASNAMLAMRISFMNQLSAYCEAMGADIVNVERGVGMDTRIGSRFIHAGIGYGGSCFPKDVKGLISSLKEAGADASLVQATHDANEHQKRRVLERIKRVLEGSLKGKRIALWGLSFKPKTDDVREAPSVSIAASLIAEGAVVAGYDPEAGDNFRRSVPEATICASSYDAAKGADLLLLATEWDEFRNPDWQQLRSLMRTPRIFDGRNIYAGYRKELEQLGFTYVPIGAPPVMPAR